jgi:hypothetical protein
MADHASPVGPGFLTTQTADPGLTAKLWRGIDRSRGATDPLTGFFHVERGQSGVGAFTSTQATTGTALFVASPTTGIGSVLELDCNSNTDGQGIQVQYPGLGVYPKDGMVICWETMVQLSDIATTGPEFFAGLATLDPAIIASDAMDVSDWIGFLELGGAATTVVNFGVEDGSQDISATTAHTFVDGAVTTDGTAWVRLGFRWEVGTKLEAYVNGAEISTSDVAESNAPDGAIVCSYVCQCGGTNIDSIARVAYTAFGYSQIR